MSTYINIVYYYIEIVSVLLIKCFKVANLSSII